MPRVSRTFFCRRSGPVEVEFCHLLLVMNVHDCSSIIKGTDDESKDDKHDSNIHTNGISTINGSTNNSAKIDPEPELELEVEPENENMGVLRGILQEIIEKSGLISLLDSHLRNESFIEIENHSDLYYLIFQVTNLIINIHQSNLYLIQQS